jgi:hypothetical protein
VLVVVVDSPWGGREAAVRTLLGVTIAGVEIQSCTACMRSTHPLLLLSLLLLLPGIMNNAATLKADS